MGIVIKQSFKNTLIIFLGFAIGGLNVLFLFTHFLDKDYYGLITFLLSAANIVLPLMVLGMQHTVVKFYSSYRDKELQDGFLITSLLLPLLVIIPVGIFGMFAYEYMADLISVQNPIIKKYTYLIFLVSIFMGYFEVFYAWTKVQFQSVVGNFIKEVFVRFMTSILLMAVYFGWLTNEQFIYAVICVYFLQVLVMFLYAITVYKPKFKLVIPPNIKEILSFSAYIIMAGSAGTILLEIDKFMIPQMKQIAEVAYYSVGIYIATVVALPTRAMQQIITPITAKELNENNLSEVEKLYKSSSINLLIIGGLLFLLINLNLADMYLIINKPEFANGFWIVLFISMAKLYEMALGTGNAIISNSAYYRIYFYLSLAMALAVIFLNKWLIGLLGIDGAAIATFLVVFLFNTIKIFFIRLKFDVQPFSINSVKMVLVTTILLLLFLKVEFTFNPFISIILKSSIIGILYFIIVYFWKLSAEFNGFVNKIIKTCL
ncbi:MAG: oligosaccharide flippase family protein [Flavobacteriaceae bacterium]|nr:oligosaccharide flippase family protein [Flavobacteriaceae bacterium]